MPLAAGQHRGNSPSNKGQMTLVTREVRVAVFQENLFNGKMYPGGGKVLIQQTI